MGDYGGPVFESLDWKEDDRQIYLSLIHYLVLLQNEDSLIAKYCPVSLKNAVERVERLIKRYKPIMDHQNDAAVKRQD